MIIADTNLIAYLLIEGEKTESARRVYQRDPEWRMPPLWRSEFLSVLATSVRAGVIDDAQALDAWRYAKDLFPSSELEPGGENVLRCAIEHGISAYDAQFVALAREHRLTLVTGDKKLCEVCSPIATSIDAFAEG